MALSDSTGILASPYTIIERREDSRNIAAILDIVDQQQVKLIVAGLPIAMDGSLGQQAKKVKAFAQSLSSQTQVAIEFRDERLTTVEARRIMLTSRSKKNRKKSKDDAVAAAVILQEYLDESVKKH